MSQQTTWKGYIILWIVYTRLQHWFTVPVTLTPSNFVLFVILTLHRIRGFIFTRQHTVKMNILFRSFPDSKKPFVLLPLDTFQSSFVYNPTLCYPKLYINTLTRNFKERIVIVFTHVPRLLVGSSLRLESIPPFYFYLSIGDRLSATLIGNMSRWLCALLLLFDLRLKQDPLMC